MRKFYKPILISLVLMLVSGIGFFMSLTQPIGLNDVQADVSSVSGEVINLTCANGTYYKKNGETCFDYFVDEDGDTTLINAEIYNKEYEYTNEEGNSDDLFYVIKSQKSISKQYSTGKTNFVLTTEMKDLAEKELLYVQASAGVITLKERNNSNVTIQVRQNEQTESVTSNYSENGINNIQWIKTDFIPVTSQLIEFSFTSADKGYIHSPCEFILLEPKLIFKTVVSKITFDVKTETVYPGDIVELDANNEITSISEESEYMKYIRSIHRVNYEIVEGNDYAEIIDGCLYISDECPTTTIKVKAYSKKDSKDNGVIENYKEYSVNAEKYTLKIETDFENPAEFIGEGEYQAGEIVCVNILKINDKFNFVSWIIGNTEYTEKKAEFVIKEDMTIKCNFTKYVSVTKVQVKDKIYDGTVYADVKYILDGLENDHEVEVSLPATFVSADAGVWSIKYAEDKSASLIGKDKDLYKLVDDKDVLNNGPNNGPTATIKPLALEIGTSNFEKTYGDSDPTLNYSIKIAEQEQEENTVIFETDLEIKLSGSLGREDGENVGKYEINLGELPKKNPNYSFKLIGENYLEIKKRTISINELELEEKIYDKTKNATVKNISLKNTVNNDDVKLELTLEFEDFNVGNQKINISSSKLTGEKSGNYEIHLTDFNYNSEIKKKPLTITATKGWSYFGEEIKLKKEVDGLIDGDVLEGKLSIDGKIVGKYNIRSDFSNSNYEITFNTANYEIKKRDVEVTANALNKIYGENDPVLTYSVKNDVVGENIAGTLTRTEGENVGEYEISIGSLKNDNYNLIFTGAKFTINKKEITIDISVGDKVYDGKTDADYTYYIDDLENEDKIDFSATIKFAQAEASDNKIQVIVENPQYIGDSIGNYEIKNNFDNLSAKIFRKDVSVTIESKQVYYGDSEEALTYLVEGLIGEEKLIGELKRETGTNAGKYQISLNTINNDNNKNYNILSKNIAYYKILPANISIKIDSYEKTYGDADPEFKFVVNEKLKYSDKVEEILSGKVERDEGEIPGNYEINKGTLQSNGNYQISTIEKGNLKINKKKATIEALDCEKIYGDDDPTFVYSSNGLIEGDKLSIQLKREQIDENVGTYKIICESLNDQRYNLSFNGANLTIKPKTLSVVIDQKIKTYGDNDPKFTISILNGENLVAGDEIDSLEKGSFVRAVGEDAGEYEISQGTYNLGENYKLTFTSGKLIINPSEIEISANDATKTYGENEVSLSYRITKGSLKNGDKISGSLVRVSGENVGQYDINQGSLAIENAKNYSFTFNSGKLTIEKRKITITADEKIKIYGEADPELTYTITNGKVINGDIFKGNLSREKNTTLFDEKAYERTGKYLISSDLNNENYDITFISNYLTIQRKEITITADEKTKIYGETDPELTYTYNKNDILEGDSISGELSRTAGENAGTYDIRSELTLGRNYKINFVKNSFIIKPIELTLESKDYEKIYGEANPTFEYKIISGEVKEGDVLVGGITREKGETIGKYKLISGFTNVNYNINLSENYLEIKQKDAYLDVNAQDKVFDGTNNAVIKNPVITGLIDKTVKLLYDKNNCAYFESSEIGNKVKVILHDISLTGENAENYNLVYPTDLVANITFSKLSDENEKAKFDTDSNTSLNLGTKINVDSIKDEDVSKIADTSKEVISTYKIWLEEDNKEKELNDSIDISLKVDDEANEKSNYYVYRKEENGDYTFVSSNYKDGYLEITTDKLGEFVILTDNENWINIAAYVSIGVIGLFIIIMSIKGINMKRRRKKFSRYF